MTEETLFTEALEIPDAADRAAFLDRACAGDAALRDRLNRLLDRHDPAGSFLGRPPVSPPETGSFDPDGNGARTIAHAGAAEAAGAVIGPYKLLEQIGEGGMGTVWMAEQFHPVQRKVALKLIKAGMDSNQVLARFEAERQALALMDHPNIARVLDAGTTDRGLPYFVMELVKGVPITRYCDAHRLTCGERLELFVQVCRAVHHAHQKGIIHRDLKPSNVMVCQYDGRPVPKVIDFGVAKATGQRLTERTLFTEFGQVVGTLEYMSPEQAELNQLDVDTRSDIYSLGVLLYELLTGTTPLERKRFREVAFLEVLRLIREEEPPRPSTRLSTADGLPSIAANRGLEPRRLSGLVHGELDWIVMKSLEKDRARRYETPEGLALDIRRYLDDEPVQACPPSARYRLGKFTRRNKRLLATAGIVALVLVLGTAVSTWQAIRATHAEGLAGERLETANASVLAAETAGDRATHRLYDARLAQARAGSRSRQVGQRFDGLAAVTEAAKIARDMKMPDASVLDLRNAAIACLALPDLRMTDQWPGWPDGTAQVDFDGKLETYARVDRRGEVSVRRVAGDVENARLPGSATWVVLNRDGKFLGVWSASDLQVWKLGGREPTPVVALQQGDHVEFSADSRYCAMVHLDGTVSVCDLASGQPPRKLPGSAPATRLAFHPAGRTLAVACPTSVEVRDLDTGKVERDLKHLANPRSLAWHPDGKTLAVVCSDRRNYLWDVTTGKQTAALEGLTSGGSYLAFNPSGELLASTGWEGKLRVWDSRTGRQLFGTPSGAPGTPPRFRTDGRLLAADARDGKLGLWEVATSGEYRTLVCPRAGGQGHYHNSAVRSDGRLLAVGMYGGVGLLDLATGRELDLIELPGSNLVLFEPSGALLTNGPAGLLRWPVQTDATTPGLLQIGPPQALPVPGSTFAIDCNPDGRILATAQLKGGLVLHSDAPTRPVPLGPHDGVRYVAVSHNGRWAATGGNSKMGVKIWEARSGEPVKELPVDGSHLGFSPDGKWLATAGGGLRLWAVGSWREVLRIGGGAFAFSPDGRMLAVETGYGSVRLIDPATGREFARLEDPGQDRAHALCFSPDGSQLVATTGDTESVHVWDLRAIRSQLVGMGLDWEQPPYDPPGPGGEQPVQVRVELGQAGPILARGWVRHAAGLQRARQWEKAIGAYASAVELDRNDPKALNNLAWLLGTCPDARFRDGTRAVELAGRAVKLTPQSGSAWNTLGVAQYRAEDWKAAVVALAKSDELLGGGELSFNAFFLTMAHWRLGEKDLARKWYDRAIEWMDRNKPQDEELRLFRREAGGLLGVGEKMD